MKDQLVTFKDGTTGMSCKVCHLTTVETGTCRSCIDVPNAKYTLNPIQTEVHDMLEHSPHASFVVASRTGTGKTFCAIQAIQKHYEHKIAGKVLWLNPLKQLVREKVSELQELFPSKEVLELTGDTTDDVGFGVKRNIAIKNADIIVTSQEMFDSLTRKPDIFGAVDGVMLLIIDEVHGIGDHSRGAKLDGALTRFLLRRHRAGRVPQIVALSATFDNIEDLQEYFNQYLDNSFRVITSDFSPILPHIDDEVRTYHRDTTDVFVDLIDHYKDKPGGILAMQLSIPGCKRLVDQLNNLYGEGFARGHYSEMNISEKNNNVDDFNQEEFKVLCCTPTLIAGVNVGATVIILNVSFFNPLTMEMATLPSTSIKQASGRVGRPPKYNEGWVSYIAQAGMENKADAAIKSPNIIYGAMNSALDLILNVEISLQPQSIGSLREWYDRSYSGYSAKRNQDSNKNNFDTTIQFLVARGYLEQTGQSLNSTKKGTSVATNFISPMFFEDCISVLNDAREIINTDDMLQYMSTLFSMKSSPIPWSNGKVKNIKQLFQFNWLYKVGSTQFEWSAKQPNVQWADSTIFTMSRAQSVSEELNLESMSKKLQIMNYSLSNAVVTVPLSRLGIRLEQLGMMKLGPKYLLYLACNGVTMDQEGKLSGPVEFKTPAKAVYYAERDSYVDVTFVEGSSRYRGAANNLVKHYGKPAPTGPKVARDEDEEDFDKDPWAV